MLIPTSRFVLGTWAWPVRLGHEEALRAVRCFAELGGDLVDTSPNYSAGVAELMFGEASQQDSGTRSLEVATKFGSGPYGNTRTKAELLDELHGSLRRLRRETIDLWQLHWPNPMVPVDVILEAFDAALSAGKVRKIGAGNCVADDVVNLLHPMPAAMLERFWSNQYELSLLARSNISLYDQMEMVGVQTIAWAPLAHGLLAGRRSGPGWYRSRSANYKEFIDRLLSIRNNVDLLKLHLRFASDHELSAARMALQWLTMTAPNVRVVIGAHQEGQLRELMTPPTSQETVRFREYLDALELDRR